jgi:hypothetical protein
VRKRWWLALAMLAAIAPRRWNKPLQLDLLDLALPLRARHLRRALPQRPLAKTAFSMMKAKFGDALRSKTDTALTNELLCKVLCHNICVLIQSVYELGIPLEF